MLNRFWALRMLGFASAFSGPRPTRAYAPSIPASHFEKLHKLIMPQEGESRFQEIPSAVGRQHEALISIAAFLDRLDDLHALLGELLQRYRERRLWVKEVAGYASFAASVKALVRRQIRGLSRSSRA
jgi:hypothetical protein